LYKFIHKPGHDVIDYLQTHTWLVPLQLYLQVSSEYEHLLTCQHSSILPASPTHLLGMLDVNSYGKVPRTRPIRSLGDLRRIRDVPDLFIREHITLFKLLLSQRPSEEELSQICLRALITTAIFIAVPSGEQADSLV